MQLLHLGAGGIALHPRQAGVDDIADAGHSERGFRHVGGQHNASFAAAGMENFVLLGVRQTRKQRQDFIIAPQRRFAQRFGGFADFALARQKHQNIAVAQPRQLVGGIDNRIGHVDFGFVFIGFGQRAIADFDGISAAGYFEHGGALSGCFR